MNDKLKPCPFCGSMDIESTGHYMCCNNCGASGPELYPIPDNKEVLKQWNSRFTPSNDEGRLREAIQQVVDAIEPGTSSYYVRMDLQRILESCPAPKADKEPLAVMADRKGYTIFTIQKGFRKGYFWLIDIGKFSPEKKSERFEGKTYAEAESKAREFLNGLEDKK